MKKNLLLRASRMMMSMALVAVMVVFASCSKQDDYCSVIPEDAALVARLDPVDLIQKNDVDLEKTALRLGMPANDLDEVKEFLDCGVDFESPLYLFVDERINFGLVCKVKDADDLEKAMLKEHVDVKSRDGYKWVETGNVWICFNDQKLLAYGSPNGSVKERRVQELMEQGEKKSILGTKLYEQLLKAEKPIAVNFSYGEFMKMAGRMPGASGNAAVLSMVGALVPDCNCLVTFDIDGDEVSYTTDVYPNDNKAEKLMEQFMGFMPPIEGKLLDSTIANPLVYFAGHFPGASVLDFLKDIKIPGLMDQFEQADEQYGITKTLASLEGDVSFAVADNLDDFKFLVQADTKNEDYLKTIEKLAGQLHDVKLEKTGDKQYRFSQMQYTWEEPDFQEFEDDEDSWEEYVDDDAAFDVPAVEYAPKGEFKPTAQFGSKDGRFYLTNDESLLGSKAEGKLKDFDIKGKNFFGFIDLERLAQCALAKMNENNDRDNSSFAAVSMALKDFRDVTIQAEGLHAEAVLHMQKGKSFVEALLNLVMVAKGN